MLVYAILILLPAATLAFFFGQPCDKDLLDKFYNAVDKNKDTNVTKTEVFDFVKRLDGNGDEILTLPEVKAVSYLVAPDLVGHEEYVFNLFDGIFDGKIYKYEIEIGFNLVDKNRDNVKTKEEWDWFVIKLCPYIYINRPKDPNRPKTKCGLFGLCGKN